MLRNESIGKMGQSFHCEVRPDGNLLLKMTHGGKERFSILEKWGKTKVPRIMLELDISHLALCLDILPLVDVEGCSDLSASRVYWIQ